MSKRRRRQRGAPEPSTAASLFLTSTSLPTLPNALSSTTEGFDQLSSELEITKRSPAMPRLVDAWPHLVLREAALAIALVALLVTIATVVDAPLAGPASPTQPDNPEKAPWYFIGMQEMVSYSAWSGAVLFPLLLLVGLLLFPLLDRRGEHTGRWFADVGWPMALCSALAGMLVAGCGLALWESGIPSLRVLDPAALVLVVSILMAVAGSVVRRRWSAGGAVLVAVLLGGYLLFTVVGIWCRGPFWQFYWPWQPWVAGGTP